MGDDPLAQVEAERQEKEKYKQLCRDLVHKIELYQKEYGHEYLGGISMQVVGQALKD